MNFPEKLSDFKCVTALTPTICTLANVRIPAQCTEPPLEAVLNEAEKILPAGDKVEKIFLYAPDAVGIHIWERHPEHLKRVQEVAPVRIPVKTVMPSVTPVCFGSMFSGATPDIHGIQKYEKPVLTVETIFNVFPEDNHPTLISSVNNCTIDCIFRRRPITYISNQEDEQVLAYTKLALQNFNYDLVVNYSTGYDKNTHAFGPFSEEALKAFYYNVDSFVSIASWLDTLWKDYNRLLVFCPDHGAHATSDNHGGHGTDMPEDLYIYHFYSIKKKGK